MASFAITQTDSMRAQSSTPAAATACGVALLIREWELLRAVHPNVLVVGAHDAVADILHDLRPHCRQPVVTCDAGPSLALPPRAQTGALILRNVGGLPRADQQRLMAWLDDDRRDRIQVIATNDTALWPLVEDGTFAEALYYRLNVIYVDLSGGADSRGELVGE